jgi:hypothetical protein
MRSHQYRSYAMGKWEQLRFACESTANMHVLLVEVATYMHV